MYREISYRDETCEEVPYRNVSPLYDTSILGAFCLLSLKDLTVVFKTLNLAPWLFSDLHKISPKLALHTLYIYKEKIQRHFKKLLIL
jgi:hypothetical protein